MDRQAVGFLAVMLLWRGQKADNDFDRIVDGMYYMAEALGTGHEELKEAVRIANKYKHHLYSMRVFHHLTYRESFQEAVKMVEKEIGEKLYLERRGDRWNV
jgi:hypothetical protein